MSDDELDLDNQGLSDLKFSIQTLWERFGNVDSMVVGTIINLLLASLGILVFVATTGWLSYLGVVWAIMNLLPIVQWVLGL